MGRTEMSNNSAAIRELLKAAFDDQEFVVFCYDHFRPVYDEFASGMSRLWRIQLLIDYCGRYEELDKLLGLVKKINPRQYDRFEHAIETSSLLEISTDSSRGQVEITIKGNLSNITPELQSAAIGALAGVLNIPRDQISVLAIQSGSIILQIEMPAEAVNRLTALYAVNDPTIQDLGILQVIPIQSNAKLRDFENVIQAALSRFRQALAVNDDLQIVASYADTLDNNALVTERERQRLELARQRLTALTRLRQAIAADDDLQIVASYADTLDGCTLVMETEHQRLELARWRLESFSRLRQAIASDMDEKIVAAYSLQLIGLLAYLTPKENKRLEKALEQVSNER
jgi:hypothetical protein